MAGKRSGKRSKSSRPKKIKKRASASKRKPKSAARPKSKAKSRVKPKPKARPKTKRSAPAAMEGGIKISRMPAGAIRGVAAKQAAKGRGKLMARGGSDRVPQGLLEFEDGPPAAELRRDPSMGPLPPMPKKRRGKVRARRAGRALKRMPSRKRLRRWVRRFPRKTVVTVYPRVARGRRIPRGSKYYTVRNPRGGRKMRRNPSRRRRRNPMDIMGTAKRTIAAAVPAVAGGALVSVLDAKVLSKQSLPVRVVAKLVAATAAGAFLRSRPDTAKLVQGAILGSLGAELGARMAGGTMSGLAYLVGADGQMMQALVDSSGAVNSMPQLRGLDTSFDPNLVG